jgi:putative transposase
MDRMLAGVSTRKFARVGEPVEQSSSSTSKSTVSELFIVRTRSALGELMSRRLDVSPGLDPGKSLTVR